MTDEQKEARKAEILKRRQKARSAELIDDEPEFVPVESNQPGPEPEAPPVYEPEDNWPERRRVLLQGMDPATAALITDDKLREIETKVAKKAHDERLKAALEKLEDDMLHRARVEENLLSASTLRTMEEREYLATKIRVRFALPDEGSGHQGRNGFRVDGRIYENNMWHEMTVAEMLSLRETHYNCHINEVRFSTLDQSRRAGLGMNSRAQGTDAAHILMSRAPVLMEIEPIDG